MVIIFSIICVSNFQMENMNSLSILFFCNFSNNLKGHKFGQGLLFKTLSQKFKTLARLQLPKLKIQVKMFKLISLHFFMLVGCIQILGHFFKLLLFSSLNFSHNLYIRIATHTCAHVCASMISNCSLQQKFKITTKSNF
jgi:hypothetical protein